MFSAILIFSRSINPDFTKTGTWYEFFSGSSLNVTEAGRTALLSLKQGEYRLYTSRQVERPSFLTGIDDLPAVEKPEGVHFEIFPNPFTDIVTLRFDNSNLSGPLRVEISSADGSGLRSLMVPEGTNEISIEGSSMAKGMYFVRVTSGSVSAVKKMIRY